jgi:hypothetical protein
MRSLLSHTHRILQTYFNFLMFYHLALFNSLKSTNCVTTSRTTITAQWRKVGSEDENRNIMMYLNVIERQIGESSDFPFLAVPRWRWRAIGQTAIPGTKDGDRSMSPCFVRNSESCSNSREWTTWFPNLRFLRCSDHALRFDMLRQERPHGKSAYFTKDHD